MLAYLKARFSLTANDKPHAMKFWELTNELC
jgi:hypothetical protein